MNNTMRRVSRLILTGRDTRALAWRKTVTSVIFGIYRGESCVGACVRACVCVCMCVSVCLWVCLPARACVCRLGVGYF